MSAPSRFCDSVNRRTALRVGAASLFGTGYALPRLLAAEAPATSDVSVIFLFLKGGALDHRHLGPQAPGPQ
jgi:hypothetical protein